MRKTVALMLLAVLVLSGLVMVGTVFAESIPKPSVPEFTVTVRDHSYYVSPTYRTDPYTGTSELIQEGYVAQNGTIELSIEPQQFTQYTDSEGNRIRLYFRVAYKGHSALGWKSYPRNAGASANYTQYFSASDSGYGIARFGFGEYQFGGEYRTVLTYPSFGEIPVGGQIDFKVEAFVGYYITSEYVGIFSARYGPTSYRIFTGESSDWSETQTITIEASQTSSPEPTFSPEPTLTPEPTASPELTPSPEPTLTPTPTEEPQLGQEAILGVAITIAVLGAGLGLLLYLIKK